MTDHTHTVTIYFGMTEQWECRECVETGKVLGYAEGYAAGWIGALVDRDRIRATAEERTNAGDDSPLIVTGDDDAN